mmetsp:Transcript_37669/g.121453  ORF Transcript_37669/g.121453 Transcript_37669/m.121453 type:complete len:210 (+) Transcript_37669:161-790(+)
MSALSVGGGAACGVGGGGKQALSFGRRASLSSQRREDSRSDAASSSNWDAASGRFLSAPDERFARSMSAAAAARRNAHDWPSTIVRRSASSSCRCEAAAPALPPPSSYASSHTLARAPASCCLPASCRSASQRGSCRPMKASGNQSARSPPMASGAPRPSSRTSDASVRRSSCSLVVTAVRTYRCVSERSKSPNGSGLANRASCAAALA